MKTLRYLSAASLLLLGACASPPPFFTAAPDQIVPAPRADKAQIVFLNPSNSISGAFLAQLYEVKDGNREFLGALGPKTKMVVNVDAGSHLFMLNQAGLGQFVQANVDAGKRYYVMTRFIYGRGLQLRPVRPAGGDPEFTIGNPRFREWVAESQLVTKTADADAFVEKYKDRIDEAYQRGWKEWEEKRPDQRAQLTLNPEDSIGMQ
ncbi:hypothetical protein AYO46_03535 [Betaproteobacteria bacterium SCGC AG-212-J23]|nr:hypothetical protein AYO46_03535 [Betaproteobacteria bacterium SCGC AG-212-J23]